MGVELRMVPDGDVELRIAKKLLRIEKADGPLIGESCPVFYVEWSKKFVSLSYSSGHDSNPEWAFAFALEFAKEVKLKRVGWDSAGYCSVEEFIKGRPFSLSIDGYPNEGIFHKMIRCLFFKRSAKKKREQVEKTAQALMRNLKNESIEMGL